MRYPDHIAEGSYSDKVDYLVEQFTELDLENAYLSDEINVLRIEIERLRRGLLDVIATDHHNHYDGPTARYVQIARAALGETP